MSETEGTSGLQVPIQSLTPMDWKCRQELTSSEKEEGVSFNYTEQSEEGCTKELVHSLPPSNF